MTEQELLQEALEWREHISMLANYYSDQESFRKRLAIIEWLIEKAELAIELEEEIEKWRKVKDATVKLAKENERYKKALKSIKNNYPVSNEEFIPVEMIYEINHIASEALEGNQ